MDGVQELAHDGTESLELLPATVLNQMVVVGPDRGIMLCGAERRPVEGDAQVAVAGFGQAWFFVDAGAGLVLPGIESGHGDPLLGLHVLGHDQQFTEELDGAGGGDAGDADQEVEDLLQVLIGGDEGEDLLAQVFDVGLQLGDGLVQISDQEVRRGCGLRSGVELVLRLRAELVEGGDAAGTGADGEGQGSKGMRRANSARTAASTASVLVRVCMASAKRLAALGLMTMRGSPASSRARAKSR